MRYLKYLRGLLKLCLLGSVLALFSIAAILTLGLFGFNFHRARPWLIKLVSLVGKSSLLILNITLITNAKELLDENKTFLIVCNHLSYLDVLILCSIAPTCFVTSNEMKETFFLGQLCQLGGCLFVERRRKKNISNEVRELTNALVANQRVTIFPEATSTDGSAVISFRRPLFQAAVNAQVAVLPLCLNYQYLNENMVSLENRDLLFWHDDTSFIVHAFRLFCNGNIVVRLDELPSISFSPDFEKDNLAQRSHDLVSSVYKKII